MGNQISFKERVRLTAIQYASLYQAYYVEKSYLLVSDVFQVRPYYVVEAEPDNYLHLIGVSTPLTARRFYQKCLSNTLLDTDFDIAFHGRDEKASKGSIASSNNLCTLGLIATPSARPMTLLRGNELSAERAGKIRLVLSKKRTDSLFSDIIVGSPQLLLQHLDTLKNRVSPELQGQALTTVATQ